MKELNSELIKITILNDKATLIIQFVINMRSSYSWNLIELSPLLGFIKKNKEVTNQKLKEFSPPETDLIKMRQKVDEFVK